MKKIEYVLGIESSCDETAVAVISNGKILSDVVATQHDVHEKFSGVVPELASRRHMENIVPLIQACLSKANLSIEDISAVAVTRAPGLVGSLLVGISAAKGIAYARNIPMIGVNHLEGHLNAAELEYGTIEYPYVGLVVSGGHTSLYHVKKFGEYVLMGATRDDAAGEAFDKVAKLLCLGYPGGPAIDKAAKNGDPKKFSFTKPKLKNIDGMTKEFDFSFSGIKTAVLNICRQHFSDNEKPSGQIVFDLAASFQSAVVKILTDSLVGCAKLVGAKSVVISGGVAANSQLRESVARAAAEVGIKSFVPSMKFCTDNASMIAYVGEKRLLRGERSGFDINATSNEEIGI